jgi:hypothetical protein
MTSTPTNHHPGRLTIYTLYPAFGGYSVQTTDDHGTEVRVSAVNVRQAYALAHRQVWINPDHPRPVGIVSVYDRGVGTTLWCGCTGHPDGGRVRHGDGIRALQAAISTHHCDRHHPPPEE